MGRVLLRRSWLILVVVVLLGGCGATGSPRQTPLGASGSPAELIGLWRLQADGEDPGTVLRIGADLSIWRRCSESWGGWAASPGGGFVADVSSYSYACEGAKPTKPPKPEVPPAPPAPDWLINARAFRIDGSDRLLVDATGRTLARLSPGGKPFPNPNVAAELSTTPNPDAQLLDRLRPPATLPPSLSPAKPGDVIGTWRPQASPTNDGTTEGSFTTFRADGSWTGSDGCNALGGRWLLGAEGLLLMVSRGQTMMACAGQDQAPRVALARRLGFAGPVLVLVDANGADIGQLIHSR